MLLLVVVVVAGAPGCGRSGGGSGDATASQGALPPLAAPSLPADGLWDDGRAELSVYAGTVPRYGVARPVTAKVVVVKEDLELAQRVKSDAGPVAGRTAPVLKVSYLHDFPTGTYDYHQMTTAFLDRGTLELWKLTMSSAEACGMSFVSVQPDRARPEWRHVSHSYWDGEGDRDLRLPLRRDRPTVAWDALVFWLRGLDLSRRQELPIDLLPTQLSARVQETALVPAVVVVPGRLEARGWPVVVRRAAGEGAMAEDRFWFARDRPFVLTRLETAPGLVLDLVKTQRLAYWERTRPGDEALLRP